MNSIFKVLQFNVYLIVKSVIFRGHFNAVQAHMKFSKVLYFILFFFSTFEARLNSQ